MVGPQVRIPCTWDHGHVSSPVICVYRRFRKSIYNQISLCCAHYGSSSPWTAISSVQALQLSRVLCGVWQLTQRLEGEAYILLWK